jgi:hypothetical protein
MTEQKIDPLEAEAKAAAWVQYPEEIDDHYGHQEDRRTGYEAGYVAGANNHTGETSGEDVSVKVDIALENAGYRPSEIGRVVNALQNSGILFRERVAEPAPADEKARMEYAERYFETLAKIDPSPEMARIIEQAKASLAKREPALADEHPAHRGHEYGGGYARAAALAAGDPDWVNATGGSAADDLPRCGYCGDGPDSPSCPAHGTHGYLKTSDCESTEGEPSDAQVRVGALALYDMRTLGGNGYDPNHWEPRARAVLRAAARVADQGGER